MAISLNIPQERELARLIDYERSTCSVEGELVYRCAFPYRPDDELQAELDRIVEEGMFNISIASYVEFPEGTAEGEVRIENVPSNHYLMQVEVVRDDTGESVYRTGMIEPNHHIQRARLDADLDVGSYPCTAVFYAFESDTEEPVGQAAAKMTIVVAG